MIFNDFEFLRQFLGQENYPNLFLRLEPRSKLRNREEGLAMYTADPLWMLGRQWQFGEFNGEDNGTPISSLVRYRKKLIQQIWSMNGVERQGEGVGQPTEVAVEGVSYSLESDWRARVRLGQRIENQLEPATVQNLRQNYAITLPEDQELLDRKTQKFISWMSGKCLDAWRLFQAAEQGELNSTLQEILAENIHSWFGDKFPDQQGKPTNWNPEQLVYQFEMRSEDGGANLSAPDYRSGELDWYTFDKAQINPESAFTTIEQELIPTPLTFPSMPKRRLFEFEDSIVDYTKLQVDDTDIGKLMLVEYMLAYSNDWFILPLRMQMGEAAWIDGLEVNDVFGVRTTISALQQDGTVKGPVLSEHPQLVWDLFKIRNDDPEYYLPEQHFLYVPAVASFKQEATEPLEEVLFMRDEYANFVWGCELRLCNGLGQSVDGRDYYRSLPLEQTADEKPQDKSGRRLRLQLADTSKVPLNWVPYQVRRRSTGAEGELILRRCRLQRPPEQTVASRSRLLTEATLLREEAIPKGGISVQLSWQRSRWINGETHIWLGRKVQLKKSEEESGVEFDSLKS